VIKRSILASLALAATALLAACSGSAQYASPVSPSGGGSGLGPTLGQTFAWRHAGTSKHACGPVDVGFARCMSLVRTDIAGHASAPNFTPSG